MDFPSPSVKTNRVLHLILIAFLLIAFRVWHLGVIQREEKLLEAQKPKLRTILVRADRGRIYDRFHIPLATNRICYNGAVYYGQIAQIPATAWKTEGGGNRIRTYPRREHIREMSKFLGKTLSLEAERVEDLIHAKAALLPHVPYIIKADLSETEYYQLKMGEKDWLGLSAEVASERHYPLGKVGCHVVGSLGPINRREYEAIAEEIHALEEAVDGGLEMTLPPGFGSFDAVYARLYEVKEKAYTLNDRVGKSGVEGRFEEELRGFWGMKKFEVDQNGKALRELPGGKEPIPGRDVILSISLELQQFAEELLIRNEKERGGRSIGIDLADHMRKVQKQPWIKGGAIVALDPETGEILACASHPRFDPNDFIGSGKMGVSRWLESEKFIADLWMGHQQLARDWPTGRKVGEEKRGVDWEFFIDQILPSDGSLRHLFNRPMDIKTAVQAQEDFEALLYCSKGSLSWEALRAHDEAAGRRLEGLLGSIPSSEDRLFAIDLLRLAVASPRFGDELLAKVSAMKISAYFSLGQAFHRLEKKMRDASLKAFQRDDFPAWRVLHQKEFLKAKRSEEKERKVSPKPYIDHLDRKERELFQAFWEENRLAILKKEIEKSDPDPDRTSLRAAIAPLSRELAEEFLRTFRSFHELDRPLLSDKRKVERDLAASFYPKERFGVMRSSAFQTAAPQGSLFKLITAYEGLRQGHHFSLIDEQGQDPKNQIVAYSLNRTPYPRFYKGGRLPRSSGGQIGKIDLIGAIEQSSNPYFSILAGDYLRNPEDLNTAARLFGLGERSGVELAGETAGHLPSDLSANRTGLYSYAIGQHTLLTTPLQSALMLAAIANGGHLLKPKIVIEATGLAAAKEPFSQENRFARGELDAIGISFPLFTAIQARTPLPSSHESATLVRRSVPLPPSVRTPLLEGMDRSMWSGRGRPGAIRALLSNPPLMEEYLTLKHQMIGKTSTAEILFNPSCNPSHRPQIYKHIWSGAISFDVDPLLPAKGKWDRPELIVVVFLRFGSAGKESAPIAAQMIRKWREIKKRHG